MPYELELPRRIKQGHWKVKIFDKETLYEEPHVTILFKAKKWRWGLRGRDFIDESPDPSDVPQQVLDAIKAGYDELCGQWDLRFPKNPVQEPEGDEDQ
jgi:hypothetical protein